jgi:glycine/D-amino acid oxidase-like deaminating enzyme
MSSDLPTKVDVAILGGGLAGLWLAHSLADHADVLLVDRPSGHKACGSSSLGIAAAGQGDNPARLAAGLGAEAAEALWLWSRRATDRLKELCEELSIGSTPGPVVRLAFDKHEDAELRTTAALLRQWEPGSEVRVIEREEIRRGGLGDPFSFGLHLRRDFICPVVQVADELRNRLDGRATRVLGAATTSGPSGGAVAVHVEGQTTYAEIVVVCGGAGSAGIHPAFTDLVIPVRVHASVMQQALSGAASGDLQQGAALTRHRFESWTWGPVKSLNFAGCRWAEGPDMGAGNHDTTVLNERVVGAHRAFIQRHLGLGKAAEGRVQSRSGITAYSCDGLPLVGPLLGSPRVLAMTAWGGWGLSAIGAAVEDLTFAILGRQGAPSAPRALLGPRRML